MLRHGQAFSPIYRFSLSDGTIVSAHTKSKLVRSPATNEPQLYMSLHILQRYVLLPTERQICCKNLVACSILLVPCSMTYWLHCKWVNMLSHALVSFGCICRVTSETYITNLMKNFKSLRQVVLPKKHSIDI